MAEPTRSEHLAWSKMRALQYCDLGDVSQAFASIASDLSKHPETVRHAGLEIGSRLLFAGMLSTPEEMRKFIEGFN
jgi:hypothetical protein